jgi:EAL domain-containing protein (putative c-di-GMP-specific phosphodiesterase class I)/GAF domain-containing protein
MADLHEEARLDALHKLNLLDTSPSESFDRITRMASQIFDLPVAAVSLTDQDRQWFKSRVGIEHMSIPRDKAPCARVAESAEAILIPDLLADECYRTSILAGQGVRFYAGAPLVTRDGFGLGALCVLGTEPRSASATEMAALNDLAQMVMSQIELQHAFGRVDPLSGLPNRTQFLDDLDDLGREDPGSERLVVLVDLAHAEQLNTGIRVMGADYIDDLVQEATRTLRSLLGPKRQAYHVAATQFVFLAEPGTDRSAYVVQLSSVLRQLRVASTSRYVMSASVGVAPFVTGATRPQDVLRTAHNAAADARGTETGVSIYSSAKDRAQKRRFDLINDFGTALELPEQLRIVFQPRVNLTTGSCVSAEVLLRWNHPTLGEVSPAEFIPVIEQTSLAKPTTAWVLEAACRQLCEWRSSGGGIALSINISAANLCELDFAERICRHLAKCDLPPAMIELEMTESAVMENSGEALAQLVALSDAGLNLAIDDFGTGYSSLAYLQKLPADVVKIDQSFIRDLTVGTREQTLVRSMIGLAHDLGYRVVAEGVEPLKLSSFLRRWAVTRGRAISSPAQWSGMSSISGCKSRRQPRLSKMQLDQAVLSLQHFRPQSFAFQQFGGIRFAVPESYMSRSLHAGSSLKDP